MAAWKTYFGSDDSDEEDLPFPEPLQRSAFLEPDFTPSEFLASLKNRHQTLEDLQDELRARNTQLSSELLDLVNNNYQEFLGLGTSLQGGDEKVESVRLALLTFSREVETLRSKTSSRCQDVATLLSEKRLIDVQAQAASQLLEIHNRIELLEESLKLTPVPHSTDETEKNGVASQTLYLESDDEEEGDDQSSSTVPSAKLRRQVESYEIMQYHIESAGQQHPFVVSQLPRIAKIRQTLLLDLRVALKQTQQGDKVHALHVLQLYEDMNETKAGLEALHSARREMIKMS